jgi:Tfp pilus assembly protein PilF
MIRNTKFWLLMAVFQVAFGLTVFTITRQYYIHDDDKISTAPFPVQSAAPDWPGQSAESDLEELISSYPSPYTANDPVTIAHRADEFYNQGQYDKAADLYRQLLNSGSQDVNTYNNLGITLHNLGRSAEAIHVLNEGVVMDSSYQRIWLTLGFVNSQIGHFEQARTALTKAVQLDPDTDVGQTAQQMLQGLGPG